MRQSPLAAVAPTPIVGLAGFIAAVSLVPGMSDLWGVIALCLPDTCRANLPDGLLRGLDTALDCSAIIHKAGALTETGSSDS